MNVKLSMFSEIYKQQIQDDTIQDIIFNENGNFIISMEKEHFVSEQNGDSYNLKSLDLPSGTNKVIAFTNNSDEIYIDVKNKLFTFNYKNGQLRDEFVGPEDEFVEIITLNSKNLLLNTSGKFKGINMWDLNNKKFITSLVANIDSFTEMHKINDNSFVTVSIEAVELWNFDNKIVQPIRDLDGKLYRGYVHYSSFNNDFKKLLTMSAQGELNLIDVNTRVVENKKNYTFDEQEKILHISLLSDSSICIVTNEKILVDNLIQESSLRIENFDHGDLKFAKIYKNILILSFDGELIINKLIF